MALPHSAPVTATLLTYMGGGDAAARPALSLIPSLPDSQGRATPFRLLDDTDATSRLVAAAFVTDAGTILKNVVLRTQKDQYSFRETELGAMTNRAVDAVWGAAVTSHLSSVPRAGGLKLSVQAADDGQPARLSPLFYCSEKHRYFHPPCPSCGSPLDLCCDDDLLVRFGLHPYSTSLRRYLYCPPCCGSGLQEFYLYEREAADPVTVKDRWMLMDRFRFVTPEKVAGEAFPCVGCALHEECYGLHQNARLRIAPFAFYPYYLMMYDDFSLHSQDFLRLISGAGIDEVAASLNPVRHAGRIDLLTGLGHGGLVEMPCYPWRDERSFPDLLWRKLIFLGKVVRRLVRSAPPGERLCGENIWIRLVPGEGGAASLRHFEVEVLENVTPSSPEVSGSGIAAAVGLVWLQTLLVNRATDEGAVAAAVTRYLAQDRGGGDSTGTPLDVSALGAPENIFWHPEGGEVRQEYVPLWERALAIGVRLLEGGALDRCSAELDNLMAEISGEGSEYVPGRPSEPQVSPPLPPSVAAKAEQTVLRVLSKLIEECRREMATPEQAPPAEIDDEEVATVILAPLPREKRRPVPEGDEAVTETVVLKAPSILYEPRPSQQAAASDEALEATAIIPPSHGPGGMPQSDVRQQATAGVPDDADILGETLICAPQVSTQGRPQPPTAVSEEALLEETVCMRPAGGAGAPGSRGGHGDGSPTESSSRETGQSEEDELAETVVVMPRKGIPRPPVRRS